MNFQQIRDFVNPAVGQATGIEPVETLAMPVPAAHLMQAGGGGSTTIDSELSKTSTNPVENRVITAALNNLGNDVFFRINVSWVDEVQVFDKTWQEINDAVAVRGLIPLVISNDGDSEVPSYLYYSNCVFKNIDGDDAYVFSTGLNYVSDTVAECYLLILKNDNTVEFKTKTINWTD